MSECWKPEGVIPILQSPFGADGEFDFPSLEREVGYVLDAGADAVCFPGFASEWWKLTDGEKHNAAVTIRNATAGRAKLVLNVTSQSTFWAAAEAREYAKIGADALMCLPPFVVPPGSAAVVDHLAAVLEATPLPHILQYSASLTGLKLSAAEMRSLHERFPHFGSIKIDTIPPGPMVTQLTEAMPPGEFTYIIGFAGLQLADSLRRGAHGLMGGAGHVEEDVAVFRALRRDPEAGLEAFHQLLPLLNLEMQTIETCVALHKQMLFDRRVIATPHVRAPGYQMDAIAIEELRAHSQRLAPLRARRTIQ